MKFIGVIPARYKSSRFPGKPLVPIAGKPLVIHVLEKVVSALGKENAYVATDDPKISSCVHEYGYQSIMTSDSHLTGTDRLYEVSTKISADIYLNIQGDEPLIKPEDILKILKAKIENPEYVINGMCKLGSDEDPTNVNIPKLVVDEDNRMLYISRLPIPGKKVHSSIPLTYLKQVCIYAFSANELELFGRRSSKTYLESVEDIEIVRFLEMGHKVKMVETSGASLAVDIPSDVELVEKVLKSYA